MCFFLRGLKGNIIYVIVTVSCGTLLADNFLTQIIQVEPRLHEVLRYDEEQRGPEHLRESAVQEAHGDSTVSGRRADVGQPGPP